MNLIDIVKKLPWPDGAVIVAQSEQGVLGYYFGNHVIERVEAAEIADDHKIEIVTRGEWVAAQIDMRRTVRQP